MKSGSHNDELCRSDGQAPALAANLLGEFFGSQVARLEAMERQQSSVEVKLEIIRLMLMEIRDGKKSEEPKKEWYTPVEVAELLGKKPYTVREWCRLRRINARKRPGGRGEAAEWEVSAEEIERYKNHGLLPMPTKY